MTELIASMAFDLYSVGLNSDLATTKKRYNFLYIW